MEESRKSCTHTESVEAVQVDHQSGEQFDTFVYRPSIREAVNMAAFVALVLFILAACETACEANRAWSQEPAAKPQPVEKTRAQSPSPPLAKPTDKPTAKVVVQPPVINDGKPVKLAEGVEFGTYPTPRDWSGWAIADLINIPESRRPFIRYLAIPGWGNERWWPAANFTLNTVVSHSRVIRNAVPIANGWMLRVDLSELSPNSSEGKSQLAKTIEVWDGLAAKDPYLHIPDVNLKDKIAVVSPVVPPDQAELLATITLSPGAVYRLDWFMAKALQTLNDGQYYEFRQVEFAPEKGNARDNWLTKRKVFVGTSEDGGGSLRAAMERSEVTAKPRRVDMMNTLARVNGLASITRDLIDETPRDRNIPNAHPFLSLLEIADDGAEIIVSAPNGLHDYLLANGKGEILREAPPQLVHDTTIPSPHTKRLQPGISCIACHCIDNEDGWRTVRNEVKLMVDSGLNVFADLGGGKFSREEVLDKLAGFYALNPEDAEQPLPRARRDYSTAVSLCAAGVKFEADKSIVTQIGQLTTSIVHGYEYDYITPELAAREIGYAVPEGFKGNPIRAIVGEVSTEQEIHVFVGRLMIGLGINRASFEVIYQDLLLLAEQNRQRLAAGK